MICIVNFGSTKTNRISDCIHSLGYQSCIIDWELATAADFENVSGIIWSGAPVLLTDIHTPNYTKHFAFLKNTNIPLLGICFGHQLIGLLYGATIYKSEPVRTITSIRVLQKMELFAGLSENVAMQEDHTEGISLPVGFFHLASSDKYEVEAMKHQNLNIFGVQFHPEVSGESGMQLLANFCKLTLPQ